MDDNFDFNYDKNLTKYFKEEFDKTVSKIKEYGEINNSSNFNDFLNNNFNAYAITFFELKQKQANNIFENIYFKYQDEIDESTAIRMLKFNKDIKLNCEERLKAVLDMSAEDKIKYYKEMTVEMDNNELIATRPLLNSYLADNDFGFIADINNQEHLRKINSFNKITNSFEERFLKENKKSIELIERVKAVFEKPEEIKETPKQKVKPKIA